MAEYAKRDMEALDVAGGFYCRHISAMTTERLERKSAIAAELGFRDMRIAELEKEIKALRADQKNAVVLRWHECNKCPGYWFDAGGNVWKKVAENEK